MSGTVAHRKRLLKVTAGNIRQSHLYITGHSDFFPNDCLGASGRRNGNNAKSIKIRLEGLNETIETDIGTNARTGKSRGFFRGRSWVRHFFEHHSICTGDVIALERLSTRTYRLYPFDSRAEREHDWHEFLEEQPRGRGPTVLELFAGCGGMSLGFKRAGFRTALAVEWDKDACATLRENVTERVAQCAVEDIDEFPQADVVAGGPPCQGFSNLGERVPYDPRRQLWRHFLRAVETASPVAFLMENVPPLLKSQEGIEIRRAAKRLGYEVNSWVLNAADYGVPQIRKRAFILGVRGTIPTAPPPTHIDPEKRGLLNTDLPNWITVRDAIGDLPLEPTEEDWHIGRNPTAMSRERYRCIPAGGNRWNLPLRLMPECWKKKTKGGTDLFGRLRWERPSVTIRTEFYKPEKGRYLHPVAHRPITHREAARLQGLPDQFRLLGSRIGVGKQIGNALPPPMAEAWAQHLKVMIRNVKRCRTA